MAKLSTDDDRFDRWHEGGRMIQWTTSPELIAEMSDQALLAAYRRTSGTPGDPEADVLLAEIRYRGLAV